MDKQRYHRKIIRISAEDSPNVQIGLAETRAGLQPSHTILCEGVLTFAQYQQRRLTWDKVRQHIGLDGLFWEGAEGLLYPPSWLDRAERLWLYLKNRTRIPRGMGIDPGSGTANSSWAIVDEYGLIELLAFKTKDTNAVIDTTIDLIHKYQLDPQRVCMDAGDGRQHIDRLRRMGYNINGIPFSGSPTKILKRSLTLFNEKVDVQERRFAYFNKRSELYGELSILLDPGGNDRDEDMERAWAELATHKGRNTNELRGFAINPAYYRLREQMAPIPMSRDNENRLKLPPKYKKDSAHVKEKSLEELIGYSPDELDSVVLAVHAMQRYSMMRGKAGVI